jgi:hypothetical protein
MRGSAVVLGMALAALAVAPSADAAERTKVDRQHEVRFSLDGKRLSLTIVDLPRYEQSPPISSELLGKRVLVGCGSRFRSAPRKSYVARRVRWPADSRTVSVDFRRDISSRARWCLIEATGRWKGGDIASVSFVTREPKRLLAKGRGPSGEWWRVSAWRGDQLEPCLGVGVADGGFNGCFPDDSEAEAKLSVMVTAPSCSGDTFVLGPVARSAASVTVMLQDGTAAEAKLYRRPRGSRVRARYYLAVLPGIASVRRVEARDAAGRLIGRKSMPNGKGYGYPCDSMSIS